MELLLFRINHFHEIREFPNNRTLLMNSVNEFESQCQHFFKLKNCIVFFALLETFLFRFILRGERSHRLIEQIYLSQTNK